VRVVRRHRERVGVAHPARDRLFEGLLQRGRHVQERRRTRAGVEELVRAAGGEVDTRGVQFQGHRADAVAEVPHHQRAGVVGGGGDPVQVGDPRGPVVDVGEGDEGSLLAQVVCHVGQGHPG